MAKKLRTVTVHHGGVKVELSVPNQRAAVTLSVTHAEDLKVSTTGISMLVEGGEARRAIGWDAIIDLIQKRGLRYVPDSIKRKAEAG
jgi:hypothetical protein